MINSELIYARLVEEANQFAIPEKRLGTLSRLKMACDLIADGGSVRISSDDGFTFRQTNPKINPSNIHRVVRSKQLSGPTRSFIANKTNGLLDYVHAREEERITKMRPAPKVLPTQIESLLFEIESVEVRQAMRNEIESRRAAEQELKIIKEGLRKLPQIDVREFIHGTITREKMKGALAPPRTTPSDEQREQLRNLADRLTNRDLRSLGLKRSCDDIVSMNNAPVILSSELGALVEIAGLPASFFSANTEVNRRKKG